jgi:large subunit ribosomal protein L22
VAATTTDTPRQTVARLRHLRTSPTKVRPVLSLISGQDIFTARDTLRLSDRAVSREVSKLLDSAVANAEHNDNIPEDELYVAHAFADEGPTLKRWRPRARGRGTRIRKRTTHLTIVVARLDEDQLDERRRAEAASGRGPRRVGRRRAQPAAEVEHSHAEGDSDAERAPASGVSPDAASDAVEAKATKTAKKTARKTAKKTTKKTTKKAEPAKKATKSTKKTAKKATKKTGVAKKATKKPARGTSDEEQDS